MSQKWLNCLSLMRIEHKLLSSLDNENVIEDFANEKAKKKQLNSRYLMIKNNKFISMYIFFITIILQTTFIF